MDDQTYTHTQVRRLVIDAVIWGVLFGVATTIFGGTIVKMMFP